MNVYCIFISSLESGDVELKATFPSYSKASKAINKVIEQYVKEHCVEKCSCIILKRNFSEKSLIKDKSFSDGYCFKKGKNSAFIYKKSTDVGYLRNSVEVKKVGKIGICEVQVKMPANGKSNSDNRKDSRKPVKNGRDFVFTYKHNDSYDDMCSPNYDHSGVISESEEDDYQVVEQGSRATNYEHGQHVSFISELKNALTRRRRRISPDSSEKEFKEVEKVKVEDVPTQFMVDLMKTKSSLNSMPSPKVKTGIQLGRVVGEMSLRDNNTRRRHYSVDDLESLVKTRSNKRSKRRRKLSM